MDIRSSLKQKSMFALAFYLAASVALIGTVSYFVVEPPTRDQLEKNLDLRTELISAQILAPVNNSLSVLQSIVSLGSHPSPQQNQAQLLYSLFSLTDGIAVSGGLWPTPHSVEPDIAYSSLFFNRAPDGLIDRIYSWDNPESGGYDTADWYLSVAETPSGTVSWSGVYIDPFTHVQMITASSPYYVEGEFAGVATMDISLEGLVSFVRRHAEEYNLGVVLTDGYGDVILEHNFRRAEHSYIGQKTFGDFQWQVDVVNAKRIVDEQVYDVVSKVEAGIVPIMLLCVMLGYFLISRFLIDPIVLIAQKVDDSKEGGIIDINYNSNDEIKHLINSFNQKTVFLEAEKVKAQASTKAKSAFLATLSHEIRTPMNGVLGTAQILLKSPLDDEQRRHLRTLYESGDHMMTLLNEILDFSKIEQGHIELDLYPFPLDSIIGSVNSIYFSLCAEKGLKFKVVSQVPSDRWYLADKARLRQILFNLLSNAVKFTVQGYVELHFNEKIIEGKNHLQIKVRDTGIGIANESQEKIFKPFEQAESTTTRRFGGTGLGLAIVKQLCEKMDGSIRVTSEIGVGSSFEALLQLDVCEPIKSDIKVDRKLRYEGLKALVVEDNRTNSIIISTFMSNKGFECDCVENGEQAIEAISNDVYDLVLMDNHMPVMDGIEATTAIRKLDSSKSRVLIVGCTADVFKETRAHMKSAGVDFIIPKPIDETELDDALFAFADKLYQYKPNLRKKPPKTEKDVEQQLLNFFMAVEDSDLDKAKVTFEHLSNSIGNSANLTLDGCLGRIAISLSSNQLPTSQDMDLLAVQATEFCN